jgi:hypothetical protein
MTRRAQRRFRRFLNWKTGVGALVVLILVVGIGQLSGAWDLGGLFGSAFPAPEGGYTCLPSCDETDAKFLSMPGDNMDSFTGAKLVMWVAVPEHYSSFELGFFDGDSGKDENGEVGGMWVGHWDETTTEVIYTLYADASKNGKGKQVVGEWHGNQDPMPDNDWYTVNVENVPEARNSNGHYYYRIECVRPEGEWGISAFKLRSTGYLSTGRSDLVDASFAIVGMIANENDVLIAFPEFGGDYDNPGPSTYDGSWDFQFYVPEEQTMIELWDGDFDRGTSTDVSADTDDPDTIGRPSWAGTAAVEERAGGTGSPADDFNWAIWKREPAVIYRVLDPAGDPIYTNDDPSGTEEWERFTISTDPDTMADHYATRLQPGFYSWSITGLDAHNTVWIRTDYEICPPEGCGPPVCPPCPECEECNCDDPTPTPEPTPEPTATPEPTPEPCPDPDPIDVLYVLDVSGSMNYLYPGPGTKLDAAKEAIYTVNDWVAQQNNGSRVALFTFRASGYSYPGNYTPHIDLVSGFTADIPAFNSAVAGLGAGGATPTGPALNTVTDWLPENWEAGHVPVVILISDGVPTVDFDDYGFLDAHVQDVSLYNDAGEFLTPDVVRSMGRYVEAYGQHAGETLADTMLAIQNLKATIPAARVYSIAVQAEAGGIFNDDILQYVAAKGDGLFFMAKNSDGLAEALQWAFVDSACGEIEAPPPPPPPPQDCSAFTVTVREKYYRRAIKIRIRNASDEDRQVVRLHVDNWPNGWGKLEAIKILGQWFAVNDWPPKNIDINLTLAANDAGNQYFRFVYAFGADNPAFTGHFELDNGCTIDF